MSNTTRNDVMKLASNIEVLAKEVQEKLHSDGDFLKTANELARNNLTFVFTLGEFYAYQQVGSNKTVNATRVSSPTTANFHNVRDSRGRFTKKF